MMMSVSTIAIGGQLVACALLSAYTISQCGGGGANKKKKEKSAGGEESNANTVMKTPDALQSVAVPPAAPAVKRKGSAEKKSNMDGGDGNYEDYTITGPPPQQA